MTRLVCEEERFRPPQELSCVVRQLKLHAVIVRSPSRYGPAMEVVVVPEPPEQERQALVEALESADPDPYGSAWRRETLREGTETEEP